jgi:hypothetical protein
VTEIGRLCSTCFGRFETQQQRTEGRDADLQRSLTRRAVVLAVVHFFMWVRKNLSEIWRRLYGATMAPGERR